MHNYAIKSSTFTKLVDFSPKYRNFSKFSAPAGHKIGHLTQFFPKFFKSSHFSQSHPSNSNTPPPVAIGLNFNATTPKKFKRAVMTSFVHRIYNACRTWLNFVESMQKAYDILKDYCYPNEYIVSIVNSTLERIRTTKPNNSEDKFMEEANGKTLYHIQYCGPETLNFKKKLMSNFVPIIPIYTTKKLRYVLPSLKPSIAKEMKSQVVYKINCPQCSAVYVVMTFRHLCTRISENNQAIGTITKHSEECGTNINTMENTSILDSTQRNLKTLLVLEAICIKELNPTINNRDEYESRRLRLRS